MGQAQVDGDAQFIGYAEIPAKTSRSSPVAMTCPDASGFQSSFRSAESTRQALKQFETPVVSASIAARTDVAGAVTISTRVKATA